MASSYETTLSIPIPAGKSIGLNAKRITDLVLTPLLCIFAAPLLFVSMILSKLASSGHLLYKQKRIGRNGQIFFAYKFRSLLIHDLPKPVRQGDPRLNIFGAFLRRWHLDELPQLWNVLRGEMSLVGPRPWSIVGCAYLQQYSPHVDIRHSILPGITDLAQLEEDYSRTPDSFRKGIKLDLSYVQNNSLLKDIIILLKTPKAIWQHKAF